MKYDFTPISIMRKIRRKKVKKIVDTPKISCYYKTPPRREQASGGAFERNRRSMLWEKQPMEIEKSLDKI